MTEHEKPREWLVEETGRVNPHFSYFRARGPSIGSLSRIRVVEAEPVELERDELLDLISARRRYVPNEWTAADLRRKEEVALRKHGRLL